ncbi:hypothetical protein [Propionicimonas sp.]
MTIVRRIIATAAVAGTLVVLPVSAITAAQSAGITVAGGQGSWPFGK